MCGIAGIVSLREGLPAPGFEALRAMIGAMGHRGPDGAGIFRDPRAGLAHVRLSIIDVEGGQQPLSNEDGTLWVVYNGEIFNYVELRAELVAKGHVFRTACDTEVIVHAFESWGERAFERFNGQFALALWDTRARRLVLCRDRLGVRPLHLLEHANRLFFGSEVKALFAADASIPRAFDPTGLDQTFTFWAPVPPVTVFAGITELEPGHVRIYEADGRCVDRPFWAPSYPVGDSGSFGGSLEHAVRTVKGALADATELRVIRSDVGVGAYLSGGLDSAVVAALAQRVRGGRLSTFSLEFEDPAYDEAEFQRSVVQAIGSDHRAIRVGRCDIANAFPAAVAHAERPLLRTAPAPLFLLSKLVRDSGIKVVLTGEGADEMFGGYDLFREAKVRRFWARQPSSSLRPRLLERLYPTLARSPVSVEAVARRFFGHGLGDAALPGFGHATRWRTTASLKRLFSRDLRDRLEKADPVASLLATLPPDFSRWSPLAQDQYLEVRTLLAGYLLGSQGDRMLMAHSVEGRFPFLDPDVVELANSLPATYKLRVLDEKHVLKRAAEGLVPPAILRRKKQPYRAPDALLFAAHDAPGWVRDALDERALREAGVFEPGVVAALWKKCRAIGPGGRLSNADDMALVGVLSTQLLHTALVARPSATGPSVVPGTVIDRTGDPSSHA